MKRALVTGGAGFIGSHLADALLNTGYEVVVMDNESTGFRKNVPQDAHYVRGDVTEKKDIEKVFSHGIEMVFHIAGQASTIRSFHNPLADLTTNIIGTVNVLEMCLERKVTRFLYASSMTCYGHPDKIPTFEDTPSAPISYYGITKYAAERYVLSTALRNDLNFDFNATAFRMFNVYGERQSLQNPYQGVMAIFIGNLLRNEPITIHSDGEQSRDFVYIGDVVDAWMSAVENPQTYGGVFNLGTGEGISMNQLVDQILWANGKDRASYPVRYGPERPGDQRHMKADISKVKSVLNWSPKISMAEGMDRTIRWASDHWQKQKT
jgi:UDP-glucose 4-epimerase